MKLKFISALLCLEDSLLGAKSLNLELSLAPRLRKMNGSEFKVSRADVVKTKTSPRRTYLCQVARLARHLDLIFETRYDPPILLNL